MANSVPIIQPQTVQEIRATELNRKFQECVDKFCKENDLENSPNCALAVSYCAVSINEMTQEEACVPNVAAAGPLSIAETAAVMVSKGSLDWFSVGFSNAKPVQRREKH